MRADRSTLLGVALVCFANLLLEVLVTRIFSAMMFYHFTFLAVGLAMFGIAASGVYVFVNEARFVDDVRGHMARNARRFAAFAILGLVYTIANPVFTGYGTPNIGGRVIWQLLLLVGFTAVPFFYAGVVVSLALTFFRQNVERVYFFDLAGAAVAAVACGLVLGLVGGPSAELVAATAALVAAGLFEQDGARRFRWLWPALSTILILANLALPLIRVGAVKFDGKIKFEKWNVFSRITVDSTNSIKIDSAAATTVNDLRTLTPDLYKPEITALALSAFDAPPDHALIIGPGGGRDVLFALSRGTKHVTGVEINPIIARDVMQDRYLDVSGGLYRDPRVDIVVDDGRSFVRRSDDKYDLIQASLVDTWAATSAGAFALSENTLYTVEAFRDYFEHLSGRGVVTMTRTFFNGDLTQRTGVPGYAPECARLILLAAGALEELGVAPRDARQHLFFAGAPSGEPHGTLVAKRDPFTPAELDRLEAVAKTNGWVILVSPRGDGKGLIERMVDAGAWSDLVKGQTWNMTPTTDDHPFFFYFERVSNLLHPTAKFSDPNLWMAIMLFAMLLLSAVFIVAPLVIRLVKDGVPSRDEPTGLQVGVLSWFGVVGFSFMAVEIALMQRFSLFLGHPSYALLVILSVVLLSTAVGAWLSGRFAAGRLARVVLIAGLAIAAFAAVYGLVLGDLLRGLIGLPLVARIAVTAILVTPCGLLMGAMVPSVVRVLGEARSPLVPWGWGINGATSVAGTSIATVVAVYGGFTLTFVIGAAGYAIAALVGARVVAAYHRLGSTRA
jgi:spermidine synthase